jgi:hypothetical protein
MKEEEKKKTKTGRINNSSPCINVVSLRMSDVTAGQPTPPTRDPCDAIKMVDIIEEIGSTQGPRPILRLKITLI